MGNNGAMIGQFFNFLFDDLIIYQENKKCQVLKQRFFKKNKDMAKKPLESRNQRFGIKGFDLYITDMPIYDFAKKDWRGDGLDNDSIIYRRNLLGAMHPNVNCAIGAIPPNKSPDEAFISKYWELLTVMV